MKRRTLLTTAAAVLAATPAASRTAGADSKNEPAPPVESNLKLRYAVNVGTHFTQHPMLDRLRLVAEAGFPGVENNGLLGLDRKGDAPNLKAIEAYGETLRKHNLSHAVWVTNPCAGKCDCSLVDPKQHERFFKLLDETIQITPLVDGTISTVTSGVELEGAPSKEMTKTVIEALKRAAGKVEKS
ncbi:MAG: hypothetical protein ACRC1K_17610, partial [Planctomycetia bacterium]